MKRKDMIKLMCDTFYEENKYIFDDPSKRLNMFDTINGMFSVLDKMEEAGMLPPKAEPFLEFLGYDGTCYRYKNLDTGEEITSVTNDFLDSIPFHFWDSDNTEDSNNE
jgi:hypothetical protein